MPTARGRRLPLQEVDSFDSSLAGRHGESLGIASVLATLTGRSTRVSHYGLKVMIVLAGYRVCAVTPSQLAELSRLKSTQPLDKCHVA